MLQIGNLHLSIRQLCFQESYRRKTLQYHLRHFIGSALAYSQLILESPTQLLTQCCRRQVRLQRKKAILQVKLRLFYVLFRFYPSRCPLGFNKVHSQQHRSRLPCYVEQAAPEYCTVAFSNEDSSHFSGVSEELT